VLKIIWNLQQAMRDDMRRRATFGITIENFTTRVWFCCRSSVVVSEAFDFMKVRFYFYFIILFLFYFIFKFALIRITGFLMLC